MAMATVAGIGLVIVRRLVAGRAVARLLSPHAVVQRELVPEAGARPGARRMALGAVVAEAPLVHLRLGMTRRASLRRALEGVVDVASLAIQRDMLPSQLEPRQSMVEV